MPNRHKKIHRERRVLSVRFSTLDLLSIVDYLELRDLPVANFAQMLQSFIAVHLTDYREKSILPLYTEEEAELLLGDRVLLAGKRIAERAHKAELSAYREGQVGITTNSMKSNLTGAFFPTSGLAETVLTGVAQEDFFSTEADPNSLNSNSEFYLDMALKKADSLTLEELYPSSKKADFGFDDLDDLLQSQMRELEEEDNAELLRKLTIGTVKPSLAGHTQEYRHNTVSEKDPDLAKDKLWKTLCLAENASGKYALRVLYFNLPKESWSSEKAEAMLLSLSKSLEASNEIKS